MNKKPSGFSLENLLEQQLQDQKTQLIYDERKFYLQVAHLISDLRL